MRRKSSKPQYHMESTGQAIIIPSGEGKTYLASRNSNMFQDADDNIDFTSTGLGLKLVSSADWDALSSLYRYATKQDGRVLLCGSPDCVPDNYGILAVVMLEKPTGIRYNKGNRSTIMEWLTSKDRHVDYFVAKDQTELGEIVKSLACKATNKYLLKRGITDIILQITVAIAIVNGKWYIAIIAAMILILKVRRKVRQIIKEINKTLQDSRQDISKIEEQ